MSLPPVCPQNGFLCVACPPGPAALHLPSFSTFREVCEHSLIVHRVTLLERAVQSSTLLPDKLATYLCRLCTPDHREVFLCEILVKKHLETHSAFFLKRWEEYTEIQCRICEAVISVTDLQKHVDKLHPIDMFADISDIDYTEVKTLPKSPATQDWSSPKRTPSYSKPNLSPMAKEMRGWQSSQPDSGETLLWSSCFQPEQLISRYFSKLVPVKLEQEDPPLSPPQVKTVKPLTLLQTQILTSKPKDDQSSSRSPSQQEFSNNSRFPCMLTKQSQRKLGKRSPSHPTYNNNLRSIRPIKQSPGKQSRRSPSPVSREESYLPSRPTKQSSDKNSRSPSQPVSSDTQRSPTRQTMWSSGKQRRRSQSPESCDDRYSSSKPTKQSLGKISRSPNQPLSSDTQRSPSRPGNQSRRFPSPVSNDDRYSPSRPTEQSPDKHSRSPSQPVSSFLERSISKQNNNVKTPTRCSMSPKPLSTQERELPPAQSWCSKRQSYDSYNNSTTTRCLFCGLQVAKSMLTKHSTYEHQDMMFRCNIGACRQGRKGHYRRSSFFFSNQLNNHQQDYHNFSRNYFLDTRKGVTRLPKHLVRISCSKCPYFLLYPDLAHMLEHLWSVHRLEDVSLLRYQCRVCSGQFSSLEQVIEYSRDHRSDRSQALKGSPGKICWSRYSTRSRAERSRSPDNQARQTKNIRRSPNRRSQSTKTSTNSSSSERMRSSSRKSRRSQRRRGRSPDSQKSRHSPNRKSSSSKSSSSSRRSLSRNNSGFPNKRNRRFLESPSNQSRLSPSKKFRDRRSRLARRSGRSSSRRSPSGSRKSVDCVCGI